VCGQEVRSPLDAVSAASSASVVGGLDTYLSPPPPLKTRSRHESESIGIEPMDEPGYAVETLDEGRAWQAAPAGLGLGIIPAAIGASVGAGLAAVVWVVVAVTTGYEIGWLAVLVGAAAGWGASMLASEKSPSVGLIAAVIGAAGVIGGSYVAFAIMKDDVVDATVDAIVVAVQEDDEFQQLGREEREQELAEAEEAIRHIENITYFDALSESPRDLGLLVLFGVLGLYYGYRVGSGSGKS
jgi:hypothetical protein